MKVRCHQAIQGHSTKDAYAARLIISQKEDRRDSPKSIDFLFLDSRREISEDKDNFVLEIQPVDSAYQRTAAICSQWKKSGTPSKYTHWLIPEDGDTESSLRLMKRAYFMNGTEMSELYETPKVLTMKEIEVEDESLNPQWNLSETQRKTLTQFLALYWTCLTKRSMGTVADIQIPLILRDEASGEILTGERAAEFFAREIYSRMPKEAQGMISVSFGIKWSEAQNSFKKSVCAVLSSETGVSPEKKVDLMNNNRDILSKYPHDDRIAMNSIGQCLMEGEGAYPEWYLALRGMNGGIPGMVAPLLMHFCGMLRNLENAEHLDSDRIEKCYYVILMHIRKANGNVAEAQQILAPLVKKIISLWELQKHPSYEYYKEKRSWAAEQAGMTENQISELMEPLAIKVLDEIKNSGKLSSRERITNATALLKDQTSERNTEIISLLEEYLAQHFEEWILIKADEAETDICKVDNRSFRNIIDQCDFQSFKANPETLISAFQTIISSYHDLDDSVKDKATRSINILWVKDRTEQFYRVEKNEQEPDINEIKKLAEHIRDIGSDAPAAGVANEGLSYIQKHYTSWIVTEPAIIANDNRFLDIAKQWASKDLHLALRDYDTETLNRIEQNLSEVFNAYRVSLQETDQLLEGLRRIKGQSFLQEIINDELKSDAEKASGICDLHYLIKNQISDLTENDELDIKFVEAMLPYFRAWQETTPPFTSLQNARYRDSWFVTVAEKWIYGQFGNEELSTLELETLLADLGNTLKSYRIEEEEQNRILRPVLRSWSMTVLQDLQGSTVYISEKDKAIQIAETHNRLKAAGLCQTEDEEENRELTEEMLKVFYAWSEGMKPFASGNNQKYTDDWFVLVAENWLKYELRNQHLTAEEIEELENKINIALKAYQIDEVRRNEVLFSLRTVWGEEKLLSLKNENNWTPDQVVSVAEIHDRLHKFEYHTDEYIELENYIRFELLEHYLEWEKASKPFVSNHGLRYTDSFFVSITDEWLDHNLNSTVLSVEELEKLETDILQVLKYYQTEDGIRVKVKNRIREKWGNEKLFSVKENTALDNTQKALAIADIHNQLNKIDGAMNPELEEDLKYEMLELFVPWGQAQRPFASGENWRYEDAWFEEVFSNWIRNKMEGENLSPQEWRDLIKQLRDAIRGYNVPEGETLLNEVRKKYADVFVKSIGNTADSSSNEQMAELLFCDRAVSSDEDLKERLIDCLASGFIEWSNTTPPFKVGASGRSNVTYNSAEVFLMIYHRWQEYYLLDSTGILRFSELKDRIRKAFDAFRIPQRTYEEHSGELECRIKYERFNEIKNETITPDLVAEAAGIRRWLEENGHFEDYHQRTEIEDFIKNHVETWLNLDKPLYTDGFGYNDSFALSALQDWIAYQLDTVDRNRSELNTLHRRVDLVMKEFKRNGIEIDAEKLRVIEKAEFRAFINELPDVLTAEQLKDLTEHLISLGEDDDRSTDIFIEKLSGNYKQWALGNIPFTCKGCTPEQKQKLIIRATQEWLDHHMSRETISYDELLQISWNLHSAGQSVETGSNDKAKIDNLLITLEKEWMNNSIKAYPGAFLKISQIAGAKDRILSKGGMLNGNEELALKNFLIYQFLPWSKEAFESENKNRKYTYDGFLDIIDEWVQTNQIKTESVERIAQLETIAEKALAQGYGYSQSECERCLAPFHTISNNRLLEEAEKDYSNENLQLVLHLYEEKAIDYYPRVFAIYHDLISQGKAGGQVSEFLSIQEAAWEDNHDPEFRRKLIEFLNEAYLTYPAEKRPEELKEAMKKILVREHYDLSAYKTASDQYTGWDQFKDILINYGIKKLFKNTESIADLKEEWEAKYYPKSGVNWNDIVSRDQFRKELINRIRKSGYDKRQPKESLQLLGQLTNDTKDVQDPGYRKALREATAALIQEDYSSLSETAEYQEYIENILDKLEQNNIDILPIKQTDEFIIKSYANKYSRLSKNWDPNEALKLLQNRPRSAGEKMDFENPGKFIKADKWLMLSLLYAVPKTKDAKYWKHIISNEGFNQSTLDDLDIKDEKVKEFIDTLQWNYHELTKARLNWALDDLKNYLKMEMPKLWKALHPFSLLGSGNVLKKMGIDRNKLADDFHDWLFKSR